MTQVSGTRSDSPAQRPSARPQAQRPAQPEDVRAMSDAFAAARAKMKFEALPGKQAKPMLAKGMTPDADRKSADAALGAAFDRKVLERQQSERQADGQGLALPGQPAAPPPIMLAAMPSPQVDPSGFAQMLADLWTRENGRGAKEVRVRFGADAWPATGALLVRNAAGALDISVSIGDRSAGAEQRLAALGERLGEAGLPLGALTIDREAAI